MKKSPLVSVIIVNWNGGHVFKDCLKSLRKVDYRHTEVLIIDNGSTDGTQKLATIKNSSNLGFARANNQGVQIAKGKYILLLNNDTLIEPDFLSKLVFRIESDSRIGVIQPKIHLMDHRTHLDSVGSFLTITGFLQHWGYLSPDGPEFNLETPIFSAKGACMLIRMSIIKKIGLFDPDFGSYFEETDFCWRVWLSGWKVLYYPNSHIFHKVGFTSKFMDPIGVNYNSFKNRLSSLIKNLSLSSFYILFIHMLILICLVIYYILRFQADKSSMVCRAVFWNLIHLQQTSNKRRFVQSHRVLTDTQLFSIIMHPINYKSMLIHFLRSEKDF